MKPRRVSEAQITGIPNVQRGGHHAACGHDRRRRRHGGTPQNHRLGFRPFGSWGILDRIPARKEDGGPGEVTRVISDACTAIEAASARVFPCTSSTRQLS